MGNATPSRQARSLIEPQIAHCNRLDNCASLRHELEGVLKLALLLPLALTGCVTVDMADQDGGTRTSRTHIGITRIVTVEKPGAMTAVDVKTLGLGWDNGPFLGWRSGNWVTADPAKCQLVVIVRSSIEVENAAKVLAALKGQNPCIADFTGSLAPAAH
jgi:hypothetical protein